MVSPPSPALTVPLTACTSGPVTVCHQPGTTRGAGGRAGSHPGCSGLPRHPPWGQRSGSPSPFPAGIPNQSCHAVWRELDPALPLRVLSCRDSLAAPPGPLARPGAARSLPMGSSSSPAPALPAGGRLIGVGIFVPGPRPGFILSPDICAKQAEHAAGAGGVPAWCERGSRRLRFQPDLETGAGR